MINIDSLSEGQKMDASKRAVKMYEDHASKANIQELVFKISSFLIFLINGAIGILLAQNPNNKELVVIIGWVMLILDVIHFGVNFFAIFKGWINDRTTALNTYLKYKAYQRREEPFDQKTKKERDIALDKALDEIESNHFNNDTEIINDMKNISDSSYNKNSK